MIQITQDGGAFISVESTPPEIQHLYTEGLESCIAIMAHGKKGTVLIHDSESLSVESLVKILRKVGELHFWTTAFNPKGEELYKQQIPEIYHKKFHPIGIYETNIPKIRKAVSQAFDDDSVKKYLPEDKPYFTAESGFASIDRQGKINTTQKIDRPVSDDYQLRLSINNLNNACTIDGEFECDFQYDGEQVTPFPSLLLEEFAIIMLALRNNIVKQCYQYYKYQKRQFTEILKKKYEADSLEQALIRATLIKNEKDIFYLIQHEHLDH